MSGEEKHSPFQWSWVKTPGREIIVRDADGRRVAVCHSLEGEPEERETRDEANADYIVEAANRHEILVAQKELLAKSNADLARETEKTWAKCDKLKGLLRRTVPCIESCIGHLRNDRATSLGDPKTMMAYTRTIEDVAVLLDEVREALKKEAGNDE